MKKLVKSLISMGNEARSITQSKSEKLAKAVETQHFDKKAITIAVSLYQMSINRPQAFAVTLPHLLAYIDDLGLAESANEARGMDLDDEDDGETQQETTTGHDETPAGGKSPSLTVVPGSAAPKEEAA